MIYLDNAALSYPKPAAVLEQTARANRFSVNPGRGGYELAMQTAKSIYAVRETAASMFCCESENVIFTKNCTEALNIAIFGTLRPGDHVIISCLEHNSVYRPIYRLSKTRSVEFDVAPVYPNDDERTLQSFKKLFKANTRAVICTHASNVFGTVLPIVRLYELCRERSVLFIADCAQTAGVYDFSKQKAADILCMPGHKGLLGPIGTGMMLLLGDFKPDPLLYGGTGSLSMQTSQPTGAPEAFESGTVSAAGIIGLGCAMRLVESVGVENLRRHENRLCEYFVKGAGGISKIKVYSQMLTLGQSTCLSFSVEDMHSEKAAMLLDRHGFALRGGYHCSKLAHEYMSTTRYGTVRLSPGRFNSRQDIKKLLNCLCKLK